MYTYRGFWRENPSLLFLIYVTFTIISFCAHSMEKIPKSVRNHCVIELFVALFVLSLSPFDISVGIGDFVIGLSQISSIFSTD